MKAFSQPTQLLAHLAQHLLTAQLRQSLVSQRIGIVAQPLLDAAQFNRAGRVGIKARGFHVLTQEREVLNILGWLERLSRALDRLILDGIQQASEVFSLDVHRVKAPRAGRC